LNNLGYSWLKQGKNPEQAFEMLVDAYNQAPNDGHILDSIGWAFYRLGLYDQAITYIEKAAELEPANAVISNHLGDAYWFVGRKNEAGFQWNHVLTMKDETKEVDYDEVRNKIKGEAPQNKVPTYDKTIIANAIKEISKD
jgi:tetratricopeptide (TPR) repeat protein